MNKINFLKKTFIWLRRFRYRKGYGVHSPFAFRIITELIYADTPYYDYNLLKEQVVEKCLVMGRSWKNNLQPFATYELLYRLVNESKANTILEIGDSCGVTATYLSACRKNAKCISLNEIVQLPSALQDLGMLDFLVIRAANYSLTDVQQIVEKCILNSTERSLFVIQDIYAAKAITNWWEELVADSRVGITFDLYDMGIVFFDKTKIKQHYIVNF